ncbi:MAG TPA: hypothetical protein VFH88_10940 [Candidatus Krumholzibacteria bacterium]|nr:hypothetical protein [Candidatus Krumholzibacteria bacterium]
MLRRPGRSGSCAVALLLVVLSVAATANAHPAVIEMVARGNVPAQRMQQLAREARDAAARVDTWLHLDASDVALRCQVYPTLEAKGMATSYTLPAHSFPTQNLVVCSTEPGFEGELGREVAACLIMRVLGRSPVDAMEEGLAVACVSHWRGRDCRYWATRLSGYDDVGDLDHWINNRSFRAESPLVRRAVAGELVRFLCESRGVDEVMHIFSGGLPAGERREAIARAWSDHVRELARERRPLPPRREPTEFLRGFCHAHEGYAIRDGYISAASDSALQQLRALGANAVSLTPFTFMPTAQSTGPFPFSSGARAENDESVVHAALAAQRMGMSVMLKPHVWVGRSWPGEISFDSAADWKRFFAGYERWIRHYALLAEMEDIDFLCVGVELAKATVGHEADWIGIAQRLRTVYGGRLTYAANWGGEFEHVTFWKAFDYIGINCYYPLDTHPNADDAALRAGAMSIMKRIDAVSRRYHRPVLVTEVGFPSTPAPWRSPHDDSGATGAGREAQARCFDAYLRAVRGCPCVVGVYCWKWPSDMDERDHRDGFILSGTPAEAVISSWYSRGMAR